MEPHVVGLDLSARGSAVVELREGRVERALLFTNTQKLVKQYRDTPLLAADGPIRLSVVHSPDCAQFDDSAVWARSIQTAEAILGFVNAVNPQFVAIEQIPFSATGQHRDQLFDLHALVRYALTSGGLSFKETTRPLRYYLASDVKMFATGMGNARKPDMVRAADEQGLPFSLLKKAGEDLADAYWVAQAMRTEALYRLGDEDVLTKHPFAHRMFFKPPKLNKAGKEKKAPLPYVIRPFLQLPE